MSIGGQGWLESGSPTEHGDVLMVDVEGYEGPLDLLLDLARRQKVDLTEISVLALAEQYLAFVDTLRDRRIEIAADFLVMAAWLAYLKSRLMVPRTESDEEPSGEEMAALLQFRLARLEAMREAVARLMRRPRLGVHVFARGAPEMISVARKSVWEADLYQLLRAYARQRERGMPSDYTPSRRLVWALQEAREILVRLIGDNYQWVALDTYLIPYLTESAERTTALASSFSASLELVRLGEIELRQSEAFAPLLLRRRRPETS